MRTAIAIAFLLCFLVSCNGPVYVAKNEAEGLKTNYQDPKSADLAARYQGTLHDLYGRFQTAQIDTYPGGLGFTTLSDTRTNKVYHYLLVQIRPRNISFDEVKTKPQARFGEVFENHFANNLRYVKADDLKPADIQGLAFGIYWPVRDLSQCDSHGGFIEYATIYLPKSDFLKFLKQEITFSELAKTAEIVTSLEGKPAESVKVKQLGAEED